MKKFVPKVAKEKYPYPSKFGSHEGMCIDKVNYLSGRCLCKDELGEYETDRYRLDNGLADPNRFERF